MLKGSALSEEQRKAAVAFEIGWGSRAVATKLGVGRKAVLRLHDRWRIKEEPQGTRGTGAAAAVA